jgi:hypothetical protein
MLSDLQKRKITRHFNMHNLSGDGHLSQADVELLMNNLAREFKVAPDSETFAKLKLMFEGQWNQIQQSADPNGDGRVTLDEWFAYYENIINTPGVLEMLVEGYNQAFFALFDLVDPDGPKGCYTADRWGKYFAACNQPYQDGVNAVKAMDRDGSGLVDSAEAKRAEREFYGNDPNAPGNTLFGPY